MEVTVVIMVMSIAVPMEPAICLAVLFMALPWAIILFSRALRPQVLIGIFTMARPNSLTVYIRQMVVNVHVSSMKIKNPVKNVRRLSPSIDIPLGPNLSKSLPVIGLITPIRRAPGSITSPDCIAVNWSTFWRYIGVIIVPAISAAFTIILIMVEYLNSFVLSICSSRRGVCNLSCLLIKIIRKPIPSIRVTIVIGCIHP